MTTRYVQPDDRIDFVPDRDIAAGEMMVVGDLVFVARLDIPKGQPGALWRTGVYDLLKGEGVAIAFPFGAAVYFNPETRKASDAPGEGFTRIGRCVSQTDEAAAESIRFVLNT